MRTYRLRVFGREILSWCVEGEEFDPVEVMAEAIVKLTGNDSSEEETSSAEVIGGAGSMHFERDLDPRYPEADKDYDTWMPRPFGFNP